MIKINNFIRTLLVLGYTLGLQSSFGSFWITRNTRKLIWNHFQLLLQWVNLLPMHILSFSCCIKYKPEYNVLRIKAVTHQTIKCQFELLMFQISRFSVCLTFLFLIVHNSIYTKIQKCPVSTIHFFINFITSSVSLSTYQLPEMEQN